MTTTLAPPTGAQPGRVTQARVVASEWIKLRTLRSTVLTLAAGVVCVVGLGLLISALRANDFKQNHFIPGPGFDPTLVTLRGVFLAQLPIGVLGVLLITGEYSTGMIRATLAAVPKRLPVVWAKAAVFAVAVFVTSFLAALAAFEGGRSFLTGAGLHLSLSTHGSARAVLGAALYLTTVGLLGVGLGFIIRNTAGAIATLFGMVLVLPALAAALPRSLYNDIYRYLPLPAGTQIMTTVTDHSLLRPWDGIAVLAIYAVVAIAVGAVVLLRRDA